MPRPISIVMPCYNCSATLEEAVSSVYRQGFGDGDFEIVMVDDGSIDDTREIMAKLARSHKEIRILVHEKNRGGGAARNTGIKNCRNSLVFCLDSDNILGDGVLPRMADFLELTGCDGVQFEKRKFFVDDKNDRRATHLNRVLDEPLGISSLFDDSGNMLDNFLMTKRGWELSGGFPEHHGFDTQCFEVRYLAAGNCVLTCPETLFFHRLSKDRGSYFERVYQNGELSKNYFLIYEEVLHLFSPAIREKILRFDFFSDNRLGENNLHTVLKDAYGQDSESFFQSEYSKYVVPGGFQKYLDEHGDEDEVTGLACKALYLTKQGRFRESIRELEKVVAGGLGTKTTYYCIMRAAMGLGGGSEATTLDESCVRMLEGMSLRRNPSKRFSASFARVLGGLPWGRTLLDLLLRIKVKMSKK